LVSLSQRLDLIQAKGSRPHRSNAHQQGASRSDRRHSGNGKNLAALAHGRSSRRCGFSRASASLSATRLRRCRALPNLAFARRRSISSIGKCLLRTRHDEQHETDIEIVLERFGRAVRAYIDQAAEVRDAGTVNVLSDLSRKVDTQLGSPRPNSCDDCRLIPIVRPVHPRV
jgi:hypothetical protein